jgi:hypothetical protein
MNEIKLGQIAGLKLSAIPSAIVGSMVLWIVLSGVAVVLLRLSPVSAVIGGLVAVALHWISEVVHQFGHAWAARRVGHPMTGIRFWGVLSTSLYPSDEPPLPATIHIRRALGGPAASLLLSVVAALAALALRSMGGMLWWLAVFLFLGSFFVMTLGALTPLGFNDGGTLMRWWGKR